MNQQTFCRKRYPLPRFMAFVFMRNSFVRNNIKSEIQAYFTVLLSEMYDVFNLPTLPFSRLQFQISYGMLAL